MSITTINTIDDFWTLVDECRAEGMADWDPAMIRKIGQIVKDSDFPINQITDNLDKSRTECLRLAAEAGVSGFTRFN